IKRNTGRESEPSATSPRHSFTTVLTKAHQHTDTMIQTRPRRLNHYSCDDTRHNLTSDRSTKPQVG
ncbi:hypothetical protein CORC01_01620, partial [Colletotrichum orchidophilum]